MKFNEFEYFLTIAELGSLSKAAEKLYVSQPSLTQYINRLEDNLGIKLFDRSKSPINLTPAGELYLKYAVDSMERKKKLLNEFEEIKNDERGKISFAIHFQLGSRILPDVLPEFYTRYPKIKVDFYEERSTSELEHLVNSGKVDFAIIYLPNIKYFKYYEQLMGQDIVMICSKNNKICLTYPANPYSPYEIEINEIAKEKFIMLRPTQDVYKVVSAMLHENDIYPENVVTSGNINTIINLVAKDVGISFIPSIYLKNDDLANNIAMYKIKDYPLRWPLFIVYNSSNIITKPMKLFINTFKECYTIS